MDFGERVDALERLNNLRASGALTADEYLVEKQSLFSEDQGMAHSFRFEGASESAQPEMTEYTDKLLWWIPAVGGAVASILMLFALFGGDRSEDAIQSDAKRVSLSADDIRSAWTTLSKATDLCGSPVTARSALADELVARLMAGNILEMRAINQSYEPLLDENMRVARDQCLSASEVASKLETELTRAQPKFAGLARAAGGCRVTFATMHQWAVSNLTGITETEKAEQKQRFEDGSAGLRSCLPSFNAAAATLGISLAEDSIADNGGNAVNTEWGLDDDSAEETFRSNSSEEAITENVPNRDSSEISSLVESSPINGDSTTASTPGCLADGTVSFDILDGRFALPKKADGGIDFDLIDEWKRNCAKRS